MVIQNNDDEKLKRGKGRGDKWERRIKDDHYMYQHA